MAIDLRVTDKVDSSIADKLLAIGRNAASADNNVASLAKNLSKLDGSTIRAVNRAAIDASKVSLNDSRAAYYMAREKVELARLRTEQARTAQVDSARYHQFATNAQKLATTKTLDAEKAAQAKLRTAQIAADTSKRQAEALVVQAASNVKAQYQNQLLQYTGNWAKQDNTQRNLRTDQARAQLGVTQGRQDEIIARTAVAHQKLATETARSSKEAALATVAQQRLATEASRTATATINAATAQQRLDAAVARTTSTVARSTTAAAAYRSASSGIASSSSSAAGGVRQLSGAMAQLDTSASFLRSDGLRWAKVFWALSGATLTAHAIVGAADAYTLLQNRLSVVAETQAEVNNLTSEMFDLAERSRQPVADVTKAFTRFDMAIKEMGRSQKESLVVTETVAKALQMSGATAGESASAMLQLSQAFNKGKLDGDEFRSVMENAPLIANALARELGVTRGELLKLAPAGKLTVEQLTNAIVNAAPQINEAFGKFNMTIAQSFTHLRNEMMQYFGELDKQIGLTSAISSAIAAFANNLDVLLFTVLAVAPALALLVGSKTLGAFAVLGGYVTRTSIAIGAMSSPITLVATSLANMGRTAVSTGSTVRAMFTGATSSAVAFQMATVRATAAVLALGNTAARVGVAMAAAFSFGNIFLLIGTLIAAAIAFGDKIEMAGEKSFTMRDYIISAFSEVWGFTKFVFESMYDFIAGMFGSAGTEGMTFGEKVRSVFEGTLMFGAAMVDSLLHVFRLLWTGVRLAIAAVADGIKAIVMVAVNSVVSVINGAIEGINALGAIANSILQFTGADKFIGTFGQIGKLAGMEFNSSLQAIWAEDLTMKTGAMDAVSTGLSRIADNAQERRDRRERAEELRGADAAQAAKHAAAAAAGDDKKSKAADKAAKATEKRAEMVAKAMNAEREAILVARRYGDERERVAAVEDLRSKILSKGYADLTKDEESALRALVDQRLEAERVGNALQSMYEEVVNPQRVFKAGQEALNILLKDGVIDAARYVNKMDNLKDTYAEATDALYSYRKALSEQQATGNSFGVDAEISKNVYSAEQTAKSKGLPELTTTQVEDLKNMTREMYNLTRAQQAAQAVWDDTVGTQETIAYNIDAISAAYANGTLSIDEYTKRLAGLQAQQYALTATMGGEMNFVTSMRQGIAQLVSDMPTAGQAMADAISSTLGNAVDNISTTLTSMVVDFQGYADTVAEALNRPVSTLEVMRYALADIIRSIGTEMINAVIKMGVQMAIQSAMQRSIEQANAAATVATQTATAATVAAAWTPAATMASVATGGGAAAAGLNGIQMALIGGLGLALAAIPAFKDGGILGGSGTSRSDSMLIRGSRGEMMMNEPAVRNNRPILEAMNDGATFGGGGYVDNSVSVVVNVASDGTAEQSGGNLSGMSKRLVELVRLEVQKENVKMRNQGYSQY